MRTLPCAELSVVARRSRPRRTNVAPAGVRPVSRPLPVRAVRLRDITREGDRFYGHSSPASRASNIRGDREGLFFEGRRRPTDVRNRRAEQGGSGLSCLNGHRPAAHRESRVSPWFPGGRPGRGGAVLERYVGIPTRARARHHCHTAGRRPSRSSPGSQRSSFRLGERDFFYKVVNAQLTFEVDAAGRPSPVVLHQNGQHPRLPRYRALKARRLPAPPVVLMPASKESRSHAHGRGQCPVGSFETFDRSGSMLALLSLGAQSARVTCDRRLDGPSRKRRGSTSRTLIRFDTTEIPPGNEKPLADYLVTVLKREGIDVQTFARETHRPNVVARLKGSGRRRPLLIMAHTDVVNVDPPSGRIRRLEQRATAATSTVAAPSTTKTTSLPRSW